MTFTTMQGPRVILAYSERIHAGAEIEFTLKIYLLKRDDALDIDLIRSLFEYGNDMGIGQYRNGGFGQFEVVEFTKID